MRGEWTVPRLHVWSNRRVRFAYSCVCPFSGRNGGATRLHMLTDECRVDGKCMNRVTADPDLMERLSKGYTSEFTGFSAEQIATINQHALGVLWTTVEQIAEQLLAFVREGLNADEGGDPSLVVVEFGYTTSTREARGNQRLRNRGNSMPGETCAFNEVSGVRFIKSPSTSCGRGEGQ